MANPETSIIIRAFNEERHLPRLFEEIKKQKYQDFETIVVDSGSIDLTCEIARSLADKLVQIMRRDFTFGYSLNMGIRNCKGQFVVIVSAHAFPVTDQWLGSLITPLRDERTAMVYGRQVGTSGSKFGEVQDFSRIFGTKRLVHTKESFFANNANSAVRRDLWAQYPFDETLPGLEDIDWAKHWIEVGYDVIYVPEAVIYHLHDESWRQLRHRYYREAVASKWIGLKGPQDIPREFFNGVKHLLQDFWLSQKQRKPNGAFKEIIRFRIFKAWGTAQGLWQTNTFADPQARENMFFSKTCRAVVVDRAGHALLTEIEIPIVKPSDVLIKVAYEGVCGTDLEIFGGTLSYYKTGIAKYPIIPGHEFSGRVVKVGANVTGISVGDKVTVECIQSCGVCDDCLRNNWTACKERRELGVIGLNGGYAEYVVVPGHFVHRLPRNVTLRQAILCEPLAVVLKGLKRLEKTFVISDQRRCIVVGAGPIGHLLAQILNLRGHQVDVYDRNATRRSYFGGNNIRVCDNLENLFPYNVLIDATGAPEALDKMLHNSPPGSVMLLLGLPYARREYSFEDIVSYDKTVIGSVGSSAQEFEEALQLLPQIDMNRFLQCVYPLEKFQAAWEAFRERRYLKVLLEIDGMLDDEISRAG